MLKIIITMLLIFIMLFIVWFKIPYSPLKSKFQREMDALTANGSVRPCDFSGRKSLCTGYFPAGLYFF